VVVEPKSLNEEIDLLLKNKHLTDCEVSIEPPLLILPPDPLLRDTEMSK
jgi:hypothetical protein